MVIITHHDNSQIFFIGTHVAPAVREELDGPLNGSGKRPVIDPI